MLAEDLLKELDKAGVSHMVQVTASLTGTDNRYSLEAAAAHRDRVVGAFLSIRNLRKRVGKCASNKAQRG